MSLYMLLCSLHLVFFFSLLVRPLSVSSFRFVLDLMFFLLIVCSCCCYTSGVSGAESVWVLGVPGSQGSCGLRSFFCSAVVVVIGDSGVFGDKNFEKKYGTARRNSGRKNKKKKKTTRPRPHSQLKYPGYPSFFLVGQPGNGILFF